MKKTGGWTSYPAAALSDAGAHLIFVARVLKQVKLETLIFDGPRATALCSQLEHRKGHPLVLSLLLLLVFDSLPWR